MLRWSGRWAVAFALLFSLLASPVTPARAMESRRHEAKAAGGVVYVDGVERWRGQELLSGHAWSERRDAIAFTGRDRGGEERLVVLTVDDSIAPTTIVWTVPPVARPARAVAWIGERRIGAGPDELAPKMVAEYSLAR
jgi:hypothetical protein